MTGVLAAAAVIGGIAVAAALGLAPVQRSRLGVVHPLVAWLALHALLFGIGAAILAVTGSIGAGAGWYVAGAAVATGGGARLSHILAVHRTSRPEDLPGPVTAGTPDPAPVRVLVVVLLVALALAAVGRTLLSTGLPLLATDPTGARVELAGLAVQPLRVAIPAAVIAAIVAALRRPARQRVAGAAVVLAAAVVFDLLLASRYLAAELVAVVAVAWLLAGRRADRRVIAGVAVAGVIAFAGVQVIRAPEEAAGREFAFGVERTVARVTLVQPRTLDALMSAIPAETGYLGGRTWLRRIAPGGSTGTDDPLNLGYWIYPRLFPDQDPGIRGYAAPGLIGEAWANLGPAGLGLFVLLGVVLERLGALLALRRTGTADLAAGAVLVVVLARTHALGLNGALVLVVLAAGWRLAAGKGVGSLARDVSGVVRWRT